MPFRRCVLNLLLILVPMSTAVASDGVREINQICATQTGCFPGDAAGYPVTLSAPGSYVLTSNLSFNSVLGPPGANLIEITGDRISLDLNGFGLRCSNALTGATCTGSTASGIEISGDAVRIWNGLVSGMPRSGIETVGAADEIVIEGVQVSQNGFAGIDLGGQNSIVRNVHSTSNGGPGIENGDLESRQGSVTERCIARGNGGDGIRAYGVVRNNVVRENGGRGVFALSDLIEGNQIEDNEGDGIRVAGGALVVGNLISANAGVGISGSFSFTYRGNTITSNQGGTVAADAGSPLNAGGNSCNFSLACP